MKKLGIFFAIVTISSGFSACGKAEIAIPPPKPVKASTVTTYMATGGQSTRYSATIEASSEVNLAFKVEGYVENIGGSGRIFGAGDYVQKGDVLAIVRQSDYLVKVEQAKTQTNEVRAALQTSQSQLDEARYAVQTAEAQLVEARKGIDVASSQVSQAQASYDKEKKDWERAQHLYAKESLTKADYDAAKSRYETSLANLDGAKAQLKSAEAKVQTAREQVNQNKARIGSAEGQIKQTQAKIQTAEANTKGAQIPLGDTVLRAPSSGVVVERKVEIGSLVSPGTVAFTVAQIGAVKAVFGVPDTELKSLRIGQTMSVTSEALPGDEFPASITRISPSANADSRVFEVEASINNFNGSLKPNMVVSLQTPGSDNKSDIPVIPLSAVVRSKLNPNAYAVFLVEGTGNAQNARERIVTLGETYGNVVAVSSGLKLDDQVVTTGATLIADGDRIQVTP